MINITKQGNNVIVTSDNPNSFHIGNGELSVPLNTIYYVLDDESDFIQFNSTEKGKILFNGTIGDIQVNGNIVNRENILMELDNVFNSAAISGEGGTAGVLAINGYDGYINLKSINGQSLIGSGNIEIEGGSTGVNKIIMGEEDYGFNTYQGDVKLKSNFTTFDEGDTGYDIGVGGMSEEGVETGSLWFGFRSTDGSLLLEDGGGRLDLKVNPDILGGGGGSTAGVEALNIGQDIQDWTQKTGIVTLYTQMYDGGYEVAADGMSFFGLKPADDTIIIERGGGTVNGCFRGTIKVNPEVLGGGGSVTETDPIFESWKNRNYVTLGNGATDSGEANGIVIGYNASGSNNTISIGQSANAVMNSIAIGKQATTTKASDIAIGNELGGVKTDSTYKINIGNTFKGDTSNYAYVLNEYGNYVRIPTEWTGTQAEYDALGTYYDNITYNIIEG